MLKANYELCCAVDSGLHWPFSYRRFLFLVGWLNNHIFDRYVFVMNLPVILSLHKSIYSFTGLGYIHVNS